MSASRPGPPEERFASAARRARRPRARWRSARPAWRRSRPSPCAGPRAFRRWPDWPRRRRFAPRTRQCQDAPRGSRCRGATLPEPGFPAVRPRRPSCSPAVGFRFPPAPGWGRECRSLARAGRICPPAPASSSRGRSCPPSPEGTRSFRACDAHCRCAAPDRRTGAQDQHG